MRKNYGKSVHHTLACVEMATHHQMEMIRLLIIRFFSPPRKVTILGSQY